MQLKFISVMVPDQDAALKFYMDVLGFSKMADIPMGEYRWLTVTSPDGIEGVELVLEPMAFPPSHVYQKARFAAGIPAIQSILLSGGKTKRMRTMPIEIIFMATN
jgi:catechol 2,3-dioxygenase-like lactoylglutathione lyase family enzyme